MQAAFYGALIDHLVGERKQCGRNFQAKRPRTQDGPHFTDGGRSKVQISNPPTTSTDLP
jgi:hypothetical protein